MNVIRIIIVAAVITVYIVIPAYRYYAMGSWFAYNVLSDRRIWRKKVT